MRKQKHWFSHFLILVLLMVVGGGTAHVSAATATTEASKGTGGGDISGAVTQTYNADPAVQTGMIVKLKAKDSNMVIPLPGSDIKNILGVVVPASDATIVLSSEKTTSQQILVATSGRNSILVSNQNGSIKVGDYVTISALAGIGMKADEAQTQVVGKAAGDFSGTANVIGSVDLKDTLGRKTTVSLGRIPLDIAISHNPLYQKEADHVPGFLNKVATGIANKPVSAARIYLSVVVFFLTAVLTGNLLYGGVRSGMIAVGRNPLSKKSIIHSLIQTVTAGLIVFIAGVFAVYLLLKL